MDDLDIQQFKGIAIGTPVIVYSFGTHCRRVAGKQPIVSFQNRTFTAENAGVRLIEKPLLNDTLFQCIRSALGDDSPHQ